MPIGEHSFLITCLEGCSFSFPSFLPPSFLPSIPWYPQIPSLRGVEGGMGWSWVWSPDLTKLDISSGPRMHASCAVRGCQQEKSSYEKFKTLSLKILSIRKHLHWVSLRFKDKTRSCYIVHTDYDPPASASWYWDYRPLLLYLWVTVCLGAGFLSGIQSQAACITHFISATKYLIRVT